MPNVDYNPRLINIEEVREKMLRNPIPDEVKRIRERITTTFSNIRFEEEEHRYFVINSDGSSDELKSVSATIHQFEPEVDWDTIAIRKAEKDGVPLEVLKKSWRINNLRSTTNGTMTHKYGEAYFRLLMDEEDEVKKLCPEQYEDGYLLPYGGKEKAIAEYIYDLFQIDCIYPVMPETRVLFSNDTIKENSYCGTFDLLWCIKQGDKYKLMLHDYKTNKDLRNAFNRKTGSMLKYPFGDLYNEPLSLYTLQSAAYSIPLELVLGYEVVDRRLIWVKDDGTYEKIKMDNLTKRFFDAMCTSL